MGAITTIFNAIANIAKTVIKFLGTTAFKIGGIAVTWGNVGQAIIYGGTALSAILQKKSGDLGSISPTYQGSIQTQTNQDLPIPLLYGTCKLAGNRIWQDENYTSNIKRIVAFAEGEICEYSDIKLNDIPINEIAGISINRYYGTADQEVDPIVGGATHKERAAKVGSLKNVAYLAISVPRGEKIDINYNLTAIVKGRKIRVYQNKYQYEVKYSENPAWVMFDFLTSYNGMGLACGKDGNISEDLIEALFDLDSFVEAAAYCDEIVETTTTDENGEEKTTESPRFTFNMIFDAQTSARSLIDEIYRSCRGGLFVKDGRLQFKIDKPEFVSKIFTVNDIIKGSETFQTIPQEEHYDILKCSYVSPDHEWQKVEATAEVPEYRDSVPIEHSVKMYSVTNFQQASRLAWYYINAKRIQPYFGSFQTDYKGYDLEVGDVISFDSLLMGLDNYKVKVTSVIDNGSGIFTINWRSYDASLYDDKLGSKEPTALISTITDIAKYPDDVKNFNVVQSNNLFNFVWEPNSNVNDTYEIRVGERWENSSIVKSGITDNKFSYEIPSNGLFQFWIKAFNGYNYSENATLDVINVDSVPSLNEIVKFDILSDLSGTYDENIKIYHNTLKLKENNVLWETTEHYWDNSGYYQNGGRWGAVVYNTGIYYSQVFDIGAKLESITSFDYCFTSADRQSNVLLEWAYSDDNSMFTDWTPVNSGKYTFRYCKFRITLQAKNNVQTVLTNFVVNIDVPDKDLDMELEITDPNGLTIEYSFINVPSIVATVNDNNDAYVVITEKTNTYAILKAYTNSGELTTCKVSLRAKGY